MASPLNIGFLVTTLGMGTLWYRMLRKPFGLLGRSFQRPPHAVSDDLESLSIIVPARNEAANISTLLESLKPTLKMGARILVVDDQSTDQTAALARAQGVEVISNDPKPEGWSGKNWACHRGAQFVKDHYPDCKYILFTDADTLHKPLKLLLAFHWMKLEGAQLMTAIPYHSNPSFWEQCLGPFHSMVLLITNARQVFPAAHRFFSMGQFLLFERDYYEQTQGHLSIKSELAEDLALARLCFETKRKFVVYPGTRLYEARMYATPHEFFQGWQRNFRLGMRQSHWLTFLEVFLVMAALMGSLTLGTYLTAVATFIYFQRRWGHHSVAGALLYPLGLLIFVIISITAAVSSMNKKPILWKSREYTQ